MGKPPVIIIGMHRSGTSMLTRILEKLGLFVGWRKEENNEALFFLRFNTWILKQANSSFDNFYNYKLADKNFKSLMVKLANKYIRSLRRIEFLGLKYPLKYKSLKDLDFPWGWKDPRNSITLDIWTQVFPEAKFIHIYRNPIDVAESLRKRAVRHKENWKWTLKKELSFLLTIGYIGYGDFIRESNIYEGIKLWEEYISHIFELERTFNLNIKHIRYEDFLDDPLENLTSILKYIGIKCDSDAISNIVREINPQRKYAFLKDESLKRVYEAIRNKEALEKLGYSSIL